MDTLQQQLNQASRAVTNARRRFARRRDPQSAQEWLRAIDQLRASVHVFTVSNVQLIDPAQAIQELSQVM
jgi:hypothetical protein